MGKSDKGRALIAGALLLVVAAFGWWQWESHQHERRQDREDALAIFMERPAEDLPANRTGPIALGAGAAVLFVSGVILVAADD